jgi:molybdopterin-guanine dinucleotide biosynthesis protein
LVRVVGPPGSGKTLLITSLTEALRQRGHRVASAVRREDAATVITLVNGGRVTVARPLSAVELREVAASLDPNVDLMLAEGFEDAGFPAVELAPPGGPALITPDPELLAVVAPAQVAGDFATSGPGETRGLADLIEERVIGVPHAAGARSSGLRGLLGRLRRR